MSVATQAIYALLDSSNDYTEYRDGLWDAVRAVEQAEDMVRFPALAKHLADFGRRGKSPGRVTHYEEDA